MTSPWLEIYRGDAPLLVSFPHTGTGLAGLEPSLVSPWRARLDTDWWIDQLYDFAGAMGASTVRTHISRTLIDVNRDPSGRTLYPGQATTELCPTTTFDGAPLYLPGCEPDSQEIANRRQAYFDPYHAAIQTELDRLHASHRKIVLYDCHSIRSVIPRLFNGPLPLYNLGSNSGASADAALVAQVVSILAASGASHVVDGRFKGGFITRHYGNPSEGVHALQMELACRAYLREPQELPDTGNWPAPYDPAFAKTARALLQQIFVAILKFARS